MTRSPQGQTGLSTLKLRSRKLPRRSVRAAQSLRPRLEALERRDLLASYTTPEDTPFAVSDPNLANATLAKLPEHGKVYLSDGGGFLYAPAENYAGSDRFVLSLGGSNATSPPANVVEISVTMLPVNDEPVARPDQYLAYQGSTLTVEAAGVLKNDLDVDGDKLSAALVAQAGHGTVALKEDGSFTYTPTGDYYGPDSFKYKASDAAYNSATTVYLQVANTRPIAKEDFYGVAQGGTLTINAPGVLGNDLGVSGRKLTASLEPEKGPEHGTVELKSDGSFVYKPTQGFVGSDTFTYRATDVSPAANPLPPTSSTAKVTIYVRSTAPIVIANNDSYFVLQNTNLAIAAPGVLKNDLVYSADTNSATGTTGQLNIPLNAVFVSGPSHGTLELKADGSFAYVPAKDYSGSDAFTYRAVMTAPTGSTTAPVPNPSSHDVATVTINVKANNAPPEAKDDYYSLAQDTVLKVEQPGVLANDKGLEGHKLAAMLGEKPAHGEVTLNPDGSLSYTPTPGYVGPDAFTYRAIDTTVTSQDPTFAPQTSNVAKVNLYVRSTAPTVIANNDEFLGMQNTALAIATPGVLKNDYAFSADANTIAGTPNLPSLPLTAVFLSGPSHGTLELKEDGSFSYVPEKDYVGSDTFTYRAVLSTNIGSTTNPPLSPNSHDVATVTINLKAQPTPPEARDDSYGIPQDTALTIAAPGVLGNDKGIEGHKLSAVLGEKPAHGELTLNADGSFTYKPAAGYVGLDAFTYRAVDTNTSTQDPATNPPPTSNVAKVTINVRSTAPIVITNNDVYYTIQGGAISIPAKGVLMNDYVLSAETTNTSPTGSKLQVPLSAKLVTDVGHGTLTLSADGGFKYTPATGFSGADTFTYQAIISPTVGGVSPAISISSHDIATVTIHVRAPVIFANGDAYTSVQGTTLAIEKPGVLKNDYVLYGDPVIANGQTSGTPGTSPANIPLIATIVSSTTNGELTLNSDGSFKYTPKAEFVGTDTFTYRTSLPPTTAAGSTTDAASGDADPTIVPHDVATVTITVEPINSPPQANNDYYRILQDTTLTLNPPGVLANDHGAPGHKLSVSLGNNTTNGDLVLNADGSFTYQPKAGYVGFDSFTYKVTDTTLANPTASNNTTNPTPVSNVATATIYVAALHPPVYAFDDAYKVNMGATLAVDAPGFLSNDTLLPPPLPLSPNSDINTRPEPISGYGINAKLLIDVEHGKLTFHPDGSFSYTANAGFTGADTFTYQAIASPLDPAPTGDLAAVHNTAANMPCTIDGPCPTPPDDIAVVTIFVRAPEPPPGPVAVPDFYLTAENSALEIRGPGVLGNDYVRWHTPPGTVNPVNSPSNSLLSSVLVDPPASGTVTLNADGSFKYEPKVDFVGTDTFTYQAIQKPATIADGNTSPDPTQPILSSIARVTIRVVPAVAHGDSYSTAQDTTLTLEAPGVLANDAGGSREHPLQAVLLTRPLHGTLTLEASGALKYAPDAGYTGADLFTYRVTDGTTSSTPTASDPSGNPTPNSVDVGIVKIYVRPTIHPIEAHDDKFAAHVNTPLQIAAAGLLANDYGPVNVPVSAALADKPLHGTVIVNPNGSFTYTPDDDFVGEDKFTYTATAAATVAGTENRSSTATVYIYVLGDEATPRVIPGGDQTTTDEAGLQKVADWAAIISVDPNGAPVPLSATTDKPALFETPPSIDAAGQLVYQPAPNVSGEATVTVTVHDESGDSTYSFTIRIDKPHPLFNAENRYEVVKDGSINPRDAMEIVNYLNARARNPGARNHGEGITVPTGDEAVLYYDVTGDNAITPLDAMEVINVLNARRRNIQPPAAPAAEAHGEGEDSSLLALMAADVAEATLNRKRS